MGIERPRMDINMKYLEKKTIGEAICQKLRNKDVYKTDMHKVYNLIVGHKN